MNHPKFGHEVVSFEGNLLDHGGVTKVNSLLSVSRSSSLKRSLEDVSQRQSSTPQFTAVNRKGDVCLR